MEHSRRKTFSDLSKNDQAGPTNGPQIAFRNALCATILNGQTVLKLHSVTLFVQRENSHKSNDGG